MPISQYDEIKVKEQLGRPEDKGLNFSNSTETTIVEESPIVVQTNTLGHSWIVGSPTNGKVGTNTATVDGQQQVVGSAGRVVTTKSVTNFNKTFVEPFKLSTFKDASTTATWDTTNHQLNFSSGSAVVSNAIALNDGTIVEGTIAVSGTAVSNLTLYLSTTGTASMQAFSNGVSAVFVTSGTALYWKATSAGTAVVTRVVVTYA